MKLNKALEELLADNATYRKILRLEVKKLLGWQESFCAFFYRVFLIKKASVRNVMIVLP